MKRISTKIRVWKILLAALHDNLDARQKTGYIIIEGQRIPAPDGYVPNWVFTSIQLCGSTSGIRYLRQGRGFLPEKYSNQYDFQKKKIGHTWHYRIVQIPITLQDFEEKLYNLCRIPKRILREPEKSKLKIRFAESEL
jgi:hypothetical protein